MLYTFRTFPAISELQKADNDVFVFSRLKEDVLKLEELIDRNNPDIILGIAIARGKSRLEPMAINQFNNGKVMKNGPESFQLHLPSVLSEFTVATRPTHSFCNWTMYRISYLLQQKQLSTKLAFLHINPSDISKLTSREAVYALL